MTYDITPGAWKCLPTVTEFNGVSRLRPTRFRCSFPWLFYRQNNTSALAKFMRIFHLCLCQPLPLPKCLNLCLCHLFFLLLICRKNEIKHNLRIPYVYYQQTCPNMVKHHKNYSISLQITFNAFFSEMVRFRTFAEHQVRFFFRNGEK